jgi:hypothetical protein
VPNTPPPPRALAHGIAGGLVLMAVFTAWWASDSLYAGHRPAAVAFTALGAAAAVVFLVQAVRLVRAGRSMPRELDAVDQEHRRRSGRTFGIVFAAEGLLIGVAAGVLNGTGHAEYVLPVIALVVGLHFYPMAWVFHRRLDLWLATWVTLVGVAGVLALAVSAASRDQVWAWVGVATALATASYGTYMVRYGNRLLRSV